MSVEVIPEWNVLRRLSLIQEWFDMFEEPGFKPSTLLNVKIRIYKNKYLATTYA